MSEPNAQNVESRVEVGLLTGRRVAFVGQLGGLTRRQAFRLVREHGGTPLEELDETADLIVIGADELPLDDESLLDSPIRDAAACGRIQVLRETQLWQQLGYLEPQQNVHRLYTPAMLAQLLHVPVSTVRRWHRRGLIVPVREVYRLPYFDFQEVATARRLAQLLAAGASPAAIEKKLAQLARMVPDVERPIAQLSVIVEGRQLLLRKGEGLIQSDGQRRIDFDAAQSAQPDEPASALTPTEPDLLRIDLSTPRSARGQPLCPAEDLAARAAQCEDEGVYPHAIELYRAALIAGGPRADWCFRLAELLYLTGDVVAARERYLMAIELDEQFVEARANLGCVLAELGEPLLAIAAFRGALAYHPDYPDAHYHLARTLEELGQHEEAEGHWWAFLELAPESPWADEARAHVDQPQPV